MIPAIPPVSIITGASSGIGEATLRLLARHGHEVWGLARREDRLQEICAGINVRGQGQAAYSVCDVSDRQAVEAVCSNILQVTGRVDHLIVNAGYSVFRDVSETTVDEIEAIMRVNYLGAIYPVKALLPTFLKQGSGSIIAVSSVVGQVGFPHYAAYSGSKFAMTGFFESLYHELKPHGIHVGVIYPSGTDTEFFDHESYANRASVRFYTLQSPQAVAKAIVRSIEKRIPEITRPRFYGFAIWIINTLKPLFRPLVGKLNPRKSDV